MLIPILIGVAVVVVVFLVIVAMQPSSFRYTRAASIGTPPAAVFANVNDFHKWDAWSPWAKMDPACKNTFDGAPAGTGAVFKWDGNKKIGAGCMTILQSRPAEFIQIKLEFLRPFKATNTAEFTFKPEGNHTSVTWSMFGKSNFFSKAFGLFVNFDKMIGADFEKGLAQMKAVTEAAAK